MLQKLIKRKGSYCKENRVKLVHGGQEYFDLLVEMINTAQYSVHLQTYVFNEDETGRTIGNALIRAAKKGIQVYLLADGYASQHLSKYFIDQLESAGINFRFFEPILKSQYFYFGRRLHHKVVVTDAMFALVGGVNIADRYNDIHGIKAWKDMAVFVEGEIAADLQQYCYALWFKERPQLNSPGLSDKKSVHLPCNEKCSVRLRRNDWVTAKREIWKTYFHLFNNATESITIMCSYFLPGQELRRALGRATKRGVKVKVILAGPSDVLMAKYAERYLYSWMLRNNIEVYEYQPTILHAKLAVVDQHWVTIGSYNINNISAYASIELNLDIRNKPFARSVHKELDEIIVNECIRIGRENFKFSFPYLNPLMQRLSYEVIRFLLYLFTFYFRQEE
jgi:cardiolipin synthase